jgi:GntP family gluconate:H+ symporter
LVRSIYMRTRRNYVLYVIAIGAGAVVTHSLVPPTPGPLIMVETLPGLELGLAIVAGFALGLVPVLVGGLGYGSFLNKRLKLESDPALGLDGKEELKGAPADEDLPGFWVSALPVLLPVLLIAGRTLLYALHDGQLLLLPGWLLEVADFAGNKNLALLAATVFAMWVFKRQKGLTLARLRDSLENAFLMGGMIVLITSAGGALGKMLARAGISEALKSASGGSLGTSAVFLVVLAWGLAAVLKTAQGSGTVSMITASGIMAALIGSSPTVPCHVVYIFAAIGFGSLVFSWMNDSGFWVVCKMSGFTERETLASWTGLLFVIGVVGLAEVVLLAYFLPFN